MPADTDYVVMPSLKIKKFVIRSDALVLVDCINDSDFIVALDPIICNCKILLDSFSDAILMYINRDRNMDANHTVGIGKSLDFRIWIDHILNSGDFSYIPSLASC